MPPVLGNLITNNSLPEEEGAVEINPHQGTSINQLPFDCFHLIFRRFTLQCQILKLRTVCHVWHDHIAEMCTQKSYITLKPYFKPSSYCDILTKNDWFSPFVLEQFVKTRDSNDYHRFQLTKIAKLTTDSLINRTSLFSLFAPTLTELTLYFNRNWESVNINVTSVEKLMKSFSAFTNLHMLTLYFEYGALSNVDARYSKNNNQLVRSLYEVIGDCVTREKLPTLTQLHLKIDLIRREQEFQNLGFEIDLDPHLLSQLEHFSMDFHTKRVPALMGQLNPKLTFLSFSCDLLLPYYEKSIEEQLDPALLSEPQFGPSLTHLRLSEVWDLPLKLFCNRFTGLQSVQLGPYGNAAFDEKLIKPLNQLERLVELRLHGFTLHVFPDNTILLPESRCLPRVKKLTWYYPSLLHEFYWQYCDGQFDHDLFCRTVAGQFPNLDELVTFTWESKDYAKQVRDHLHHYFKNLHKRIVDFDVDV